MDIFTDIRKRHIHLMGKTMEIITHVLKVLSQEQVTTLTDGAEGWSILEVTCHLRDFDGYFRGRAEMMRDQDYPTLPAYDHEALAIEQAYNDQDMAYVHDSLVQSRHQTIAFFKSLTPQQWDRAGVHPERGHFTMLDAVIQVSHHDIDHIEQITRILEEANPDTGVIPDTVDFPDEDLDD